MRKMTVKQLKEKLKKCTQGEMIALVTQLYKSNPFAADYLNVQFADENYVEDLLLEKKAAIHKLFFPSRLRNAIPLREAKKVISEFQKICNDPVLVIDLQLYYVECGAAFFNTYGDMPEALNDSMESLFWKVAENIQKMESDELFLQFEKRMNQIVLDMDGAGWGLQDSLSNAMDLLKRYMG